VPIDKDGGDYGREIDSSLFFGRNDIYIESLILIIWLGNWKIRFFLITLFYRWDELSDKYVYFCY